MRPFRGAQHVEGLARSERVEGERGGLYQVEAVGDAGDGGGGQNRLVRVGADAGLEGDQVQNPGDPVTWA